MKTFIPFHKIKQQEVIVVDGLHPQNLTLSHWKGANTLDCHADTSGEIALNAIKSNYRGINCPKISATHFDIDGFVGVYALFFPEIALNYELELSAMARIGDFREFIPHEESDVYALKLCCWMNTVEKRKFTRPFEDTDELKNCHVKFDYFLPIFSDVLSNIEDYKVDWEEEYFEVINGLSHLEEPEDIDCKKDVGLLIRRATEPIHYYALFSETAAYDIILSVYPENKFELEVKYTTWVDITSRPTLPRLNLKELVKTLNKIEQSSYHWVTDSITDTGPILRLEKNKLSKAERYANPTEREIYSSSINEAEFISIIYTYLKNAYRNIAPKRSWTWAEMKAI